MSEPAVTISITNSGYVDVKYTPPRPGDREFRKEAAALCMFLLVKVYGHTIRMPGAMHRANPTRTNHETSEGKNMDSTKHLYPQEVITPEETDALCIPEDMAEEHGPAWLERELADTAAWVECNLHQFRPEVRPLLSRFAGNLREAAESARHTQDIIRADVARGAILPRRMGPLEREVRGLALWLCAEVSRNTFDGREKRLLLPLYRHIFGIAGQCCALEHIADPGQSEEVREALKSLNIPTPKIREE